MNRNKARRRMGRPPLSKGQRKSVKVFFRATPALHKALCKAAKREGKALSRYISDILSREMQKVRE